MPGDHEHRNYLARVDRLIFRANDVENDMVKKAERAVYIRKKRREMAATAAAG